MKFSFVIPTYNKKEILRRTLEVLDHQVGFSRDEYEAIVVDDGSDQEVFKAIRGVNTNYRLNYAYLTRCEDSCRSRSRNYGVSLARGEYIIFIDDDIIVTPNHLKELARYYSVSDKLVILGTRIDCPFDLLQDKGAEEVRYTAYGEGAAGMLEMRHVALNNLSFNVPAHKYPWILTFTCNLSVPRQMLVDIGGFDENFKKWGYEDVELGYRLFQKGARFVVNPRLEAIHQSHPPSPQGENNYDYFVEKCKEVFSEINPATVLSIFAVFNDMKMKLKTFWNFRGEITSRRVLHFRDESKSETVKNKISEYSKTKGCEIIVNDYVKTSDLDLWIQMQDFKDSLVSYYPVSQKLSRRELIPLTVQLNGAGKTERFPSLQRKQEVR